MQDLETIYKKEIADHLLLTKEEEFDLIARAQNGDKEAERKLVECNLRLVASIAKRYKGLGMPYLDLVQEGNLGLYDAIENFDFTKNTRFSTIAVFYIIRSINMAIPKQSGVVTIPVCRYQEIQQFNKAKQTLSQTLGRKPNLKEVAEFLNISEKNAKKLNKYREFLLSVNTNRLENRLNLDAMEEPFENLVIDEILLKEIKRIIDSNLLTRKEKEIIKLKYDMDTNTCRSVREITEICGITQQRVNYLLNSAVKKIQKVLKARDSIISKKAGTKAVTSKNGEEKIEEIAIISENDECQNVYTLLAQIISFDPKVLDLCNSLHKRVTYLYGQLWYYTELYKNILGDLDNLETVVFLFKYLFNIKTEEIAKILLISESEIISILKNRLISFNNMIATIRETEKLKVRKL